MHPGANDGAHRGHTWGELGDPAQNKGFKGWWVAGSHVWMMV